MTTIKRQENLIIGKKKEREFGILVGIPDSDYATPEQDKSEHWDLIYKGKYANIKGMKKLRSTNPMVNANWHWVEYFNGSGSYGWLINDINYYIIFEGYNVWYVVVRENLYNFVKKHIKHDNNYHDAIRLPYRLYNREKKDLIMLINAEDLAVLAEEIIPKDTFYYFDTYEF